MRSDPNCPRELALVFLKLGAFGFGGPAAHIAMMEEEIVRRRNWISHERFLDLLGATNLIPGPNSTELAIHIGRERLGTKGLLIAGSCFILPAVLIVMLIAWFYVRYGALPEAQTAMYGIKPVIIAIITHAVIGLWPKAIKRTILLVAAVAAAILYMLNVNELFTLIVLGAICCAEGHATSKGSIGIGAFATGEINIIGSIVGWADYVNTQISNFKIFAAFLKIGSFLYGSGYVLLAFLQSEFVESRGWLTQSQLIDATAVGQFTPGPVFTTATFIGYVLSGPLGALAATIGIFLPAFVFVAISAPLIPKIRNSKWAGGFLDGVNAASLGLLLATTFLLSKAAIVDRWTILISVVSLVVLLRFKVNSAWLVLAGAAYGFIVRAFTQTVLL